MRAFVFWIFILYVALVIVRVALIALSDSYPRTTKVNMGVDVADTLLMAIIATVAACLLWGCNA